MYSRHRYQLRARRHFSCCFMWLILRKVRCRRKTKSSLKNFDIFRDVPMTGQSAIRKILLGLAAVCLSCPAHAIDPNRTIAQYMQERWSGDRGFPGGSVTALAQTQDGYLWIGTDKGLIRFDGSNFRHFPQASPASFPIGPVQ